MIEHNVTQHNLPGQVPAFSEAQELQCIDRTQKSPMMMTGVDAMKARSLATMRLATVKHVEHRNVIAICKDTEIA